MALLQRGELLQGQRIDLAQQRQGLLGGPQAALLLGAHVRVRLGLRARPGRRRRRGRAATAGPAGPGRTRRSAPRARGRTRPCARSSSPSMRSRCSARATSSRWTEEVSSSRSASSARIRARRLGELGVAGRPGLLGGRALGRRGGHRAVRAARAPADPASATTVASWRPHAPGAPAGQRRPPGPPARRSPPAPAARPGRRSPVPAPRWCAPPDVPRPRPAGLPRPRLRRRRERPGSGSSSDCGSALARSSRADSSTRVASSAASACSEATRDPFDPLGLRARRTGLLPEVAQLLGDGSHPGVGLVEPIQGRLGRRRGCLSLRTQTGQLEAEPLGLVGGVRQLGAGRLERGRQLDPARVPRPTRRAPCHDRPTRRLGSPRAAPGAPARAPTPREVRPRR